MRFDDRFLDEIKARLRLSDVIGRTVKLRRQGREYAGLSPFTKEKTPSFYVNDEKGFYHCFSSGKHGDLISFLQETERLSFPEAVERLAGEAGVPMPVQDARQVEDDRKKNSLQDWLETAAAWFEGELRRPAGAAARAYLEKRGLPEAEWKRFRIGYAPGGRTALKDYLVQKGALPADLVQTGVLIGPEDGGAPYDRFRDRIIFPITDMRGRVISFGGRALDPEAKAKYLNGPETDLFSKSQVLYGMYEARKILGTGDAEAPLVVVEGYMDVIACQRAGLAAVAGMGTALTEEQMALMWRFHQEPTLCFDGDGAGQRAAARVIERALPLLRPGKSFRFARVSGGKDPDDVLREQGAPALRAQLAQTVPFVEALFIKEKGQDVFETPERKVAFKARLRASAGLIADKELSAAYKAELLQRYEALSPTPEPIYTYSDAGRALSKKRWDEHRRRTPLRSDVTALGKIGADNLRRSSAKPLVAALMVAAIQDPRLVEDNIESLDSQSFGDEFIDDVAKEIVRLRTEYDSFSSEVIQRRLAAKVMAEEIQFLQSIADLSGAPFLNHNQPEEKLRELWSEAFDIIKKLIGIERAIHQMNTEGVYDFPTFNRLKIMRENITRAIHSGDYNSLKTLN